MAVPQFSNGVYDASLNYIRSNCTQLVALTAEAANYAEATTNAGSGSGKRVASVTVAPADFTVGAGSGSVLRQCAFAGKSGGSGLVAGGPTVFAWLDVANAAILCQSVENGAALVEVSGSVTFPALIVMGFTAPTSA